MSSEDEDMDCYVPDVFAKTSALPMGTQAKYKQCYQQFQKWNKLNGWRPISEELMMKYFVGVSEKNKPSTLFAIFSMLKSTFRANDDIDIGKYSKLLDFIKSKHIGYKPQRSKVFTEDEIEKFINEADDDKWLDVKVACIFVASGANSTKKLTNVKVEHVKRYDDLMLVTVPGTETSPQGTFTITGTYFSIVQKYIDLRPEITTSNRFFLKYADGKCTSQVIGKQKFFAMFRRIAEYLKLPDAERYTVHSFRKNVCGFRNTWSQSTVTDAPTTETVELDYQTGHLKASSFSYPRTTVPPTLSLPRVTHTNGNSTGTGAGMSEHVCTLGCGQVKCALEENAQSVLHAFTVMKSTEYDILDLTPAVYPLEPACRWIVAYKHNIDHVTAFNADETFDDITRSIPNNVRINQKYIRGNTAHLPAAYVIVYGVNCNCQKEATDIFSFGLDEVKCEV